MAETLVFLMISWWSIILALGEQGNARGIDRQFNWQLRGGGFLSTRIPQYIKRRFSCHHRLFRCLGHARVGKKENLNHGLKSKENTRSEEKNIIYRKPYSKDNEKRFIHRVTASELLIVFRYRDKGWAVKGSDSKFQTAVFCVNNQS